MNKIFFSVTCLGLVMLATGCSSTSTSCDGYSSRDWWANRPTPIRDFFHKGKPCNTCSPPVGQLSGFDANTAVNCDDGNCGNNTALPMGQPVGAGGPDAGVPYYPSDIPLPGVSNNTIRTNYPPALSPEEFGSGIQYDYPASGTNAEIEIPPMYGLKSPFN